MMAAGSPLRSGSETWGPVSPNNVHEQVSRPRWTVWIPHGGRGGAAGRVNSKKDLLTGRIRVSVPFRRSACRGRLVISIGLVSAPDGAMPVTLEVQ